MQQIDLQKMPFLARKSPFHMKQNCRILGNRKPLRIHWRADAPKTSHCLVRILIQRHNWAIFLQKRARRGRYNSMAIVIGPCWTTFCSQKLKRRILVTYRLRESCIKLTHIIWMVWESRSIILTTELLWPIMFLSCHVIELLLMASNNMLLLSKQQNWGVILYGYPIYDRLCALQ